MGRRGKCGRFEPNVCFLYSSLGIQRFLHWFWQRFLPLNEKRDPLVCRLSAAFDTKTEFAFARDNRGRGAIIFAFASKDKPLGDA